MLCEFGIKTEQRKIHFDDDAIKVVEAYEKLGVSFESVRWK